MELKTFVDEGREKQLTPTLYVRWTRTDNPKRILIVLRDRPAEATVHVRHRKKRPRRDPP